VSVDYFTAAITLDEFNGIRQRVNLDVLGLLEEMGIDIAGAGVDVRVTKVGDGGRRG
jgi:hypothetical protein